MQSFMRKFFVPLNVVFLMAMVYVLLVATRRSHTVDAQLLLGFIPPISALTVGRYPNRTLGAIAVLSNGLLFLAGVLGVIATALGAGARGSVSDQLVLPIIAAVCLVVGYVNTAIAWRMFPPRKSKSALASDRSGKGASGDA